MLAQPWELAPATLRGRKRGGSRGGGGRQGSHRREEEKSEGPHQAAQPQEGPRPPTHTPAQSLGFREALSPLRPGPGICGPGPHGRDPLSAPPHTATEPGCGADLVPSPQPSLPTARRCPEPGVGPKLPDAGREWGPAVAHPSSHRPAGQPPRARPSAWGLPATEPAMHSSLGTREPEKQQRKEGVGSRLRTVRSDPAAPACDGEEGPARRAARAGGRREASREQAGARRGTGEGGGGQVRPDHRHPRAAGPAGTGLGGSGTPGPMQRPKRLMPPATSWGACHGPGLPRPL